MNESESKCPFLDKILSGTENGAPLELFNTQKLIREGPTKDCSVVFKLKFENPVDHPADVVSELNLNKLVTMKEKEIKQQIIQNSSDLHYKYASALNSQFYRTGLSSKIEERRELHGKLEASSENMIEEAMEKAGELQNAIDQRQEIISRVWVENERELQLRNDIEFIKCKIEHEKRNRIMLRASKIQNKSAAEMRKLLKAQLESLKLQEKSVRESCLFQESFVETRSNMLSSTLSRKTREVSNLRATLKNLQEKKSQLLSESSSLKSQSSLIPSNGFQTLPMHEESINLCKERQKLNQYLEDYSESLQLHISETKVAQKKLFVTRNTLIDKLHSLQTKLDTKSSQLSNIALASLRSHSEGPPAVFESLSRLAQPPSTAASKLLKSSINLLTHLNQHLHSKSLSTESLLTTLDTQSSLLLQLHSASGTHNSLKV